MIVFKYIALTNFVPAVAVIRGGQVLFKFTGRKEHVDCILALERKGKSEALY